VEALSLSGGTLYVGGNFTKAGNNSVNCIAQWNGSSWSRLGFGSGMDNTVYGLLASSTDLYAGGDFIKADSTTVNGIARWNGISWSALSTGMGGTDLNSVYALALSGTNLYAGGLFTKAGNVSVDDIATWNGNSWSAPGWFGAGTNYFPSVYALAVPSSDVYAGGDFTVANANAVSRIAKWNGNNWVPLGSGVNGAVRALAVSGNDLYVGGDFTTAGNKTARFIARAYMPVLPTLSISSSATGLVVSWPSTNTAGFFLEQAGDLAAPVNWVSNTATATDDGTNIQVNISATNNPLFFRLRRP